MMIPPTAIDEPVSIADQAAAFVPLSQYNPPMITAPDPPAKIAPVIAKNRNIASLCLNSKLKKNMKT